MRLANSRGRPQLVTTEGHVDLSSASDGFLPAAFTELYDRWADVRAWVAEQPQGSLAPVDTEPMELGAPSPVPRQIFGIGLNYRLHAAEAGLPIPEVPLVFTKFASCITGPDTDVAVATPQVDWEVEVAVVIGRAARNVPAARAWDYVAGVTCSQDISARDVQMTPAGSPQFSLGKSFAGFLPMGPVLVTPDELDDRDDIQLSCAVNGVEVQRSSTSDLIFSVGDLIAYLSGVLELLPGDVILTGTPSGVGMGERPPRFLRDGDVVSSWVEGVGRMTTRFRAPAR